MQTIVTLKGKSSIVFKLINGSQLVAELKNVPDINYVTKLDEHNMVYIHTITFNDQVSYSLGDSLSVAVVGTVPYNFTITSIYKLQDDLILFTTDTKNKSTYYITPTVFYNKQAIGLVKYTTGKFSGLYNCNFINTYLGNFKGEFKYIYLKFLYTAHPGYLSLEKKLEDNPNFMNRLDKDQYVYYQYRIPDEFIHDAKLFTKGKFSKFSDALKLRIVKFSSEGDDSFNRDVQSIAQKSTTHLLTPLAQGLYLNKSLRDKISNSLGMKLDAHQELISKPLLENEIIKF